jgi:Flp pilus assembly protein TadG
MRLARTPRRGTVVVLVALCLVVLLGFTAIAIDGGLLLHDRRTVQAVADAAALAAADNLYYNYQSGQGLDPTGSAAQTALAVVKDNGLSQASVQVNIPPLSGIATGKPGYAEVIITYAQSRGFSGVFGSGAIPVAARAVAIGKWAAANNGILVLNPTAPGALTNTGGGTMTVVGAPTIVDSNAPNDATATGGGTCKSPEFDLTGIPGISGSGNWVGTIYSGQQPTPDPLRYIPEPDPSTMVVQSKNQTHFSGNTAKTYTISPGVYSGGITVSGQATLQMMPGIYYMDGGGFSFVGQGNLNASGIVIVNNPKSNTDVININGNGQINFSPPTTGIYAGISLWQIRAATNTIYLTGNGTSSMNGTFYAQHGTLNVTGNGVNDVIGSQYISYNVVLGGNGSFSVSWNANLVGRTRYIYLVE